MPGNCCGPHMSLQKTLLATVKQTPTNCSCIQCFLGSNLSYNIRKFATDDLEAAGKWLTTNKKKIFIHAPYVINIAHSKDAEMVEKGTKSLQSILDCMAATTAPNQTGTVFHIGANGTIQNVINQINDMSITAPLYLENCAGEGSKLGRNMDELRQLMEGIDDSNVGLCIDTCHCYGAGMVDMRSATAVAKMFDDLPTDNVVIHLNDSLGAFGSRKDRHAEISKGLIWTPQDGESFEEAIESFNIVRDYSHSNGWDIILETPSTDLYEMDMLAVD